jgi:biopolymer transport protein ExbD
MIKLKRHKQHKVPTLNMTSMPDLIFTVLFFFMIVTHMRTETPRFDVQTPTGRELTQPSNKRVITNLYVSTDPQGNPLIQIGNDLLPLSQVAPTITAMRQKLSDDEASLFTVNIKADRHTPMGVISDVKHELRKSGALNVRYNAVEEREP